MSKNFQGWTEKELKDKVSAGTLKSYSIQQPEVKHDEPKGKKVVKHFSKRSKEKDWIGWNLVIWSQENGFDLYEEYRFDEVRRFRYDYALLSEARPALKIAVEYEGLFSEKSGHTTVKGYTKDTEKYNLGTSQGWTILRYTALNYQTLIEDLNKLIA
jgi:hypothetical protein